MEQILRGAQRGLLMRAIFGEVLTVFLLEKDEGTYRAILDVVHKLNETVDKLNEPLTANGEDPQYGLVVGFAPALWGTWKGREIPIQTEILDRNDKLKNTFGDLFLYIKAPDADKAANIVDGIHNTLQGLGRIDRVKVGKRADGRIMNGRYLDSITNPNDPVSLTEDILMGGPYPGATFGFTQKFEFNWRLLVGQAPDSQDEMVGRNTAGPVLSQHAASAHIHLANIRDANGDQRKLLRQALSFGTAAQHAGRESGLMFVAFCNEQPRFENILKNLLGRPGMPPADRLMSSVQGMGGSYWYIPAASEIEVTAVTHLDQVYEDPHWNIRSKNDYLFYNSQDYLHQMAEGLYKPGDPPSNRVLSLVARMFSHWRDGWVRRTAFPRLQHLKDLAPAEWESLKPPGHIAERKGTANFKTLAYLLSSPDSKIAKDNGLLRIQGQELIVGMIPDFTLGRGKEIVPYLDKDETMSAWLSNQLNEWAAMGHVVPDYQRLVDLGLGGLLKDLQSRRDNASKSGKHKKITEFYRAAITSLQGVQGYIKNWAEIAQRTSNIPGINSDVENMRNVSLRLIRLIDQPPQSFHDAVQLIFSFHCCLHLVGELTSFGRLDQILWPFLQHDLEQNQLKMEDAQSVIDCLWMKIGENAFVDRAFIYDYVSYGTTSVCGIGGNFPQGGGINQWVQQITVGGYKATDSNPPEPASNPVTMLCLKAARRIPVNAPTLSLRVHKGMDEELLNEAAKTILAGGAHPILYHDDRLCQALALSGGHITTAWSRNYAADGCYEPMLAGASEFTFNNVVPMLALEQTLNQGATYGAAGPEQLRGMKQTFRSPPARTIDTFEKLQSIFLEQLDWLVIQCYNLMLNNYGNLEHICPSPLLSTLIEGCVESGRDLTGGGARFHIIAPLCIGVSNTIDSLYAIQKLVYDPQTALTTLPDLVSCLINDWGFNMIEPFQDKLMGPADATEHALRYQQLRTAALSLPKWGSGDGNAELNELANWLIDNLVEKCVTAIRKPSPALKPQLEKIAKRFDTPFEFLVTPGIGTFEGYVGDGEACGASADGRRNGMPIASDLSPAPGPQDLPPNPAFKNIYKAMKSWNSRGIEIGMSNASPVDMNIPELFPLLDLQKFLKAYAAGEVGGNLITLTCADLSTYVAASDDPERYNLIRVRMGGWTEYYATMFPGHQDQHQRRQYFTPGK